MSKDPVCGINVDENKTEYKMEYGGKAYYFCAQVCKTEFEKNPEKYLK